MMEIEVKKFAYWYILIKITNGRVYFQDQNLNEIYKEDFVAEATLMGGIDYRKSYFPKTNGKQDLYGNVWLICGTSFFYTVHFYDENDFQEYLSAVSHFRNTLLMKEYKQYDNSAQD